VKRLTSLGLTVMQLLHPPLKDSPHKLVGRNMSRKGDCQDNFAENFFITLKVELVYHYCYKAFNKQNFLYLNILKHGIMLPGFIQH
jgi:hypothetical protein